MIHIVPDQSHLHSWCTAHTADIDMCATAITEPAPGIHLWLSDYGPGQMLSIVPFNAGVAYDLDQVRALVDDLNRYIDLMTEEN